MPWEPLTRRDTDPAFEWNPAVPKDQRAQECWTSARYQCLVYYMGGDHPKAGTRQGMIKLSIHSHDRGPVRNWRHLQQIKNEVAGELRTAVEVFPPENMLTDTANEYHLFVLPVGVDAGFGLGPEPIVTDDEMVETFNDEPHKGQQEPWEEGLTTGRTEHSDSSRERLRGLVEDGELRPPRVKRHG